MIKKSVNRARSVCGLYWRPSGHHGTMFPEEVKSMTEKQKQRRREYQREWAKRNPEKIRDYRVTRMRRAALAAILAERAAAESGQKQTKEGEAS